MRDSYSLALLGSGVRHDGRKRIFYANNHTSQSALILRNSTTTTTCVVFSKQTHVFKLYLALRLAGFHDVFPPPLEITI